jgi:hypothetical protein
MLEAGEELEMTGEQRNSALQQQQCGDVIDEEAFRKWERDNGSRSR